MTVAVKICGLTRVEDALTVAAAGADYAGLVLYPGSPRHLAREQARAIAERLAGRVRIVALLVDPSDGALAEAMAAAKPDFIQLHGSEPPARVAEIRQRCGKPVIKAIGVADETDFAPLAGYEAAADLLLFDAKPVSNAVPGGSGSAFDWQLLRTRIIRKPWLLAGGLTVDNVARAIGTAGARGVDVSSGVETSPGVKDPDAIRAFIATARAAAFTTEPAA
jgi:phosphoribosylanthranilate isomerase